MKKSNIVIAVFAVVMAAASVASAEGLRINFDGRATDAVIFKEAVKLAQEKSGFVCHQVCYRDGKGIVICRETCTPISKSEGSDLAAGPVPEAVRSDREEMEKVMIQAKDVQPFYKLEIGAYYKLRDNATLLKPEYFWSNHDIASLINDKRTEILYTERKALFVHASGPEEYTTIKETTDKNVISFLQELDTAERFKMSAGNSGRLACIGSHVEEECTNKKLCNLVCTGVGVANGGAGEVCHQVCEWIPECRSVLRCDSWG